MIEATLEDPWQILRAQEREARDKAMASMKAEGIDYEERLERIQEVTYPKPLEELLDAAFERYCAEVPWANDYELSPKSVLRDMIETASDLRNTFAAMALLALKVPCCAIFPMHGACWIEPFQQASTMSALKILPHGLV